MSSNRKKNIHKNKNKSKSASSRPASASTSAVASSPPDSDVDEQLLASEEEERTEDFESASGSAEIEAKLQHSLQLEASQYSHQHPNDARLAARGNVKDVDISDLMMTTAEGHELLTLARLRLMHGRKYGLVGRNGIGKSTLLRRIANKQIGGFPSNLRCYMVDQEMEGTSKSLLQSVLDVDTERTRLLALEKTLVKSQSPESEAQLNDIYEQLTAMDSDSAESRAAEALDEVGFSPEQQKQTTQSLSGGFRMRVAIAAAIFMQPDVLLLDEPTNFLDLHGVLWLTDYIRSLDITCVIVSHDATFLTDVTDMTIHFHLNQLKYYHGNFETFVQTRADSNANIQRQQEALDAKRAHIRDSIEKMKAQAKRSNKSEMKLGGVASRQKKLGRMGFEHMPDGSKFQSQVHGRRIGCANDVAITTDRKRVAVSQIEPPDPGFKFVLPEPNMEKIPEGVALLSMKDVCFGYGLDEADMERLRDEAREEADRVRQCLANGEVPPPPSTNIHSDARLLLAQVEFTLRAGEKVGLVGANGQGKSTFLKLLCGKLTPSSGMVTRYEGVRIGLFTQHFVDQLDLRLTPVQHLLQVAPSVASEGGNTEQAARAVLGRFGLAGKLALAPIGTLSGGQKARLVFACITSQNPQILVLDEPSNHLDFVTIAALMDCIRTFAGAVLLVSHDQALMECCQQLWCVEERKLTKSSTKVNPNQLKAAALKAQKEITAAAIKAAKEKKSSSASSSSSSAARVAEKLTFPSRSVVRKLDMTFDDYREMVANEQ